MLRLVKLSHLLLLFIIFLYKVKNETSVNSSNSLQYAYRKASVFIVILVRNKEFTLPYFFSLLENLEYPKSKIALWIRSDHNIDRSIEIVDQWVKYQRPYYHSIDWKYFQEFKAYNDEKNALHWSKERYKHIINLKEEALETAREKWADFIWFLDCDVMLTNPQTLQILINQQVPIIAPMLNSVGYYSNFWCGMRHDYYYQRTEDYFPILFRNKKGIYEVSLVHSAVLINLQYESSVQLSYNFKNLVNYTGPEDDIIVLAISSKQAKLPMFIINMALYGFIPSSSEDSNALKNEIENFIDIKLESLALSSKLLLSETMLNFVNVTAVRTLGVDKVFFINLERRLDRRERMLECFKELGIKANLITAIDGNELTSDLLNNMGIKILPGFEDPYVKRSITKGEIGCFLSHYRIWNEMINHGYKTALIFEDDIRFQSHFRQKFHQLLQEIEHLNLYWDLIYLGRKNMENITEKFVPGSKILVEPNYSYWTLSYLLSLQGAQKLLNVSPLLKLLPVDEFLPILYDRHPKNLKAFSIEPLLVYPTHYSGEDGYISDTEESFIISQPSGSLHSEL